MIIVRLSWRASHLTVVLGFSNLPAKSTRSLKKDRRQIANNIKQVLLYVCVSHVVRVLAS